MKHFALAFLLLASTAMAQSYDYSKKFGIGASFGYNTPVFGNITNDIADGDQTWDIHLRYHLNSSTGLEAAFTKHEFSDTKIAAQVTDVIWFKRMNATERLSPIFGAGLGVVDFTHYEPNSLKLGIKLRGGLEYAILKDLSLGLNVDYQHINKMLFADNLPTRNAHILAAKVGVTWYFGGAAQKASNAVSSAATKIIDQDSDNDGVSDKKDKCPGTAIGAAVNAYGCAEKEKASVSLNVMFPSGKTTIAPGYDSDLNELAAFMNENPNTKVEIQGHTDNSGSKALNKKLSQLRAESVKTHLVKVLSINASRVIAKGYGDESPIADNKTAEGRAKNRRVIAVIE